MEITLEGVVTLLGLALLGMGVFVLMLWLPLRIVGLNLKDLRKDGISMPEAIFYGQYSIAVSIAVHAGFNRFLQ